MKKKISKALYWIPRILAIIFILFISLFSLDVFDMGLGFWGTLFALFTHLIPSFLLTGILIVAWKYEIAGAITFITFGLMHFIWTIIASSRDATRLGVILGWSMIIAIPAIITGILFWFNWKNRKERGAVRKEKIKRRKKKGKNIEEEIE